MASAFFRALNAIKRTRGSDGYVIYTDEYQQESDCFGGGNTFNNALGPIGEAEVAARSRALGAYFGLKHAKKGAASY